MTESLYNFTEYVGAYSHQMDAKSFIQAMLSPSKADLWVVMLYTNYLVAGMNFAKWRKITKLL